MQNTGIETLPIPGFRIGEKGWDPRIPGFRIPGLQSLLVCSCSVKNAIKMRQILQVKGRSLNTEK